jgi:hypothetical protein
MIGQLGKRITALISLSPLIVAGVIAFMLQVVEFGVLMDLPLVFLVLIYVFWVTPNYFFEIIEFKALGNHGWPVFSLETFVAGRNQIGVVFSILVLLVAGGYIWLRSAGAEDAARLLLGGGLVLLPASMALLAVTREFRSALHPFKVMATAVAMGYAYLFCVSGAVAILILLEFAQERGGLLYYFALMYALFLQAYLIGSIVYARRRDLGVNAVRSPEAKAARAQAATIAIRNGVLSHAYGFAAHGNKRGALAHIEDYVSKEDDSLEARLWMLDEISRWEDKAVALKYGRRIVDYCEQHGLADEAARVKSACERFEGSGDH